MNAEAISTEILEIRRRLDSIEEERRQLPTDVFSEKADLIDEEHELRARLIRLQDASLSERETQQLPGVPGFPAVPPPV
jgi:hypothetical protein